MEAAGIIGVIPLKDPKDGAKITPIITLGKLEEYGELPFIGSFKGSGWAITTITNLKGLLLFGGFKKFASWA